MYGVEGLFGQIHTDHKWSVDLRQYLEEICQLLGMRFSVPEKFISHRWLSCYDLSLSTLQMWDAYVMFYYAFVKDNEEYKPVIEEIFKRRNVSENARKRIITILATMGKKKMTEDGIKRMKLIVERVLYQEQKTLLILHFYVAVLSILKSYVKLFQSKEPLVHIIHDKQQQLFKDFLSCYVKPEAVLGKNVQHLKEMTLDRDNGQFLDECDMFVGKGKIIIKNERKSKHVVEFLKCASTAYIETGKYLQMKLPLSNPVLRYSSGLDPEAHGHSQTTKSLKKLKQHVQFDNMGKNESEDFDLEVNRFQVDESLPQSTNLKIDEWWSSIQREGKYPVLSRLALMMCTIFHGPMVESSFNIMGDVIKSANTSTELYSAVQTVKYNLRANGKSAVEMFSREDVLHDKVNGLLCKNLSKASATYRGLLLEKNADEAKKKESYQLTHDKPLSKQKMKIVQKKMH